MKHRVLQLIGSFEQGGSEAQAVQLSTLLARSGRYEVHVACLDGRGVLRAHVERELETPIPEYRLTSFYDRNFLAQLGRFVSRLRQLRPAVIHTHDFYTNIFGMAAGALAGIPVRIASRRESAVRSRKQRLVERMAFRTAHKVVANCEEVRRQLIAEGVNSSKTITVYNGVNLARFRGGGAGSVRASLLATAAEGKQVVTLLANLRLEMKDHPTFLRAAGIVNRRLPDSIFVIAGEGPLLEPMQMLAAELGIGDNVRFIGHCDDIPELLAASDVCVLSSKSEGFSNSILEYMAAGRPVVATDVGGAREAIIHGETGYLVNACDSRAMADWITSLLQSPETAHRMGKAGRSRIVERFSSNTQLTTVEAMYDHLIPVGAGLRARPSSGSHSSLGARPALGARPSSSSDGSTLRGDGPSIRRSTGKIRLLIVAPSLDILGGQAIQAARLISRLKETDGIDVSFQPINPKLPGVLAALQRIKYIRTALTSLVYVAGLCVRSRHADILHVFSASYLSFILAPTPAILIGRLFGKKVILNYRSGEAEDHLRRWPRTSAPIMRLAHKIVVPSGYLVDVFRRFRLAAQAVHNIVDFDQFVFRSRPDLRPVFLANRNLEPNYNVACVLRAFSIIQTRFPEARLTIAGDGSLRPSLHTLARDLNLANVKFVGRISADRMHRLYDEADIYLNGSDVDNMPGSLIEAFASGTPVVSTNAGGIPYIVSDGYTGLLASTGDHLGLARAAISLLEDPAVAQSIIRNAYTECRKYCWEAAGPVWINLYEELLSGLNDSLREKPLKEDASMHETVRGA